jgi:N utilization substance protein A
MLNAEEMIKGETYRPTEHIKVYVLEVKDTPKGPKVLVSRTHPEFVKRLFEAEVTEVRDGTVEIKSIAREAGSRTKMAVWSNNPDLDPVGACVGVNGARVNAVVDELHGEKIDIINWDENAALLIENALSPAKVISVIADGDEKTAKVVVPDYQLSLAIGKEGQNARLAARLTGFKIDIKSETQARESGDLLEYEEDYYEEEDGEEYYEDGEEYYEEYYEDTEYAEGDEAELTEESDGDFEEAYGEQASEEQE